MLLAALLTLVSCGGFPEPETRTPKVLVIGIDGVRPDVLADVTTPHIDELASEGFFTAQAQTVRPTVSGPSWSSLLLGVGPEKHGVTNNDFNGKRYAEFPDFLTRIEQESPELNTFAVADWKPLVAAEDGQPTISDLVDVKHVIDGYETGWAEGDEEGVRLAEQHLATSHPDAMFVYLGTPDEVSHQSGSIGEEYRAAIAVADSHVGRLVRAVRDRPTYAEEDWLILISTDHGRTEAGGHGGDTAGERTIFYLAHGPTVDPSAAPGAVQIMDVAVTALAHVGLTADPAWLLDGRVVGLRSP